MPLVGLKKSDGSSAISTVIASFLHFDMCFTIWVLLGALGVAISTEMGLSPAQQTFMVAVPTLSGSIMRIVLGFLSDRFQGKRVGIAMLLFLFIPLLLGGLLKVSFPVVICIGLMLGVAGSSFAVALPLASRWYPPERQGLVMGIAAAGNMGVVFANLIAPSLAKSHNWHFVFLVTMIPLAIVLIVFAILAKDSPTGPRPTSSAEYLTALKQGDLWWFCLLYSVTFGGFVGLGSFLPLFFHNQYHLTAINAGYLTALATFVGSTVRPLGGFLADRFGGVRALSIILLAVAVVYATASLLLPINYSAVLLITGIGCLGLGNGSVFQLVPQRFRSQIGLATGIVGAFGGVGGFFLPIILGLFKQSSGSYAFGWIVLSAFALIVLIVLRFLAGLRKDWRSSWSQSSTDQAIASDAAILSVD